MSKLIEKEGRFYKECGVVMLDTDTPSKFGFLTQKGKDVFNDLRWFKGHELPKILDSVNQHLYITSDDEIKDNDKYIENGMIFTAHSNFVRLRQDPNIKKIIATTDTSLGLPQPSDKFIQAYIEAYNKGEKIEKIAVYGKYESSNDWKYSLKNNNIIIKKVKDSWTRDEVEQLLIKHQSDYRSSVRKTSPLDWSFDIRNWINENL